LNSSPTPHIIKLTFLGTGTSVGVPVLACDCPVCRSTDPRDKRTRTSALLEINDKTLVIDCGPDFRNQMLANQVMNLDAILITHGHRDHIAGLDDIRGYNYILHKPINIFASEAVFQALNVEFPYIFKDTKYLGAPQINQHFIDNKAFTVFGIPVMPVKVMHHKMEVFGFRIYNLTYITDASFIATEELAKIKGTDTLVLNALRKSHHISHFSLNQALEIIEQIQPRQAFLVHMSHAMGKHAEVQKELPENVFLAYDNLSIEIPVK
jgi:phosphoribosyl 1,2-cyclic phosphate phosphodiesterase